MCGGCPPKPPTDSLETGDESPEPDPEDVEDLLADIEDMAMWHHAGSPPDFEQYPFEISRLFRQWTESEREIDLSRQHRQAVYLKAKLNPN